MTKALVTGAAGQVGCRLVRQLLAKGYEIKGLLLPDDPAAGRLDGLVVERIEGDLRDPAVAERAVEGVDAVIHTANLVGRQPGVSESDLFDNNVLSTFNLVKAASQRADRLERFVHVSSSAVYPNDTHLIAPCYSPMDERHPLRPMGTYPLSKLLGEEIVHAHARETGLRAAIIRPSGICSGTRFLARWSVGYVCTLLRIGQRSPQSTLYMDDGAELWLALEAAAPADTLCAVRDDLGRPWMQQPVDARDVAGGCVAALESPAAIGEAFNISAPQPIAFDRAAQVISEHTGQPIIEWQVPVRWVFDLDNTKARTLLGFRANWGLEEMVQSALAVQRGEGEDYT